MYRAWLRQAAHTKAHRRPLHSRHYSSPQQPPKPEHPPKARYWRTREKLDRWIARSPRRFQPHLTALRDAPTSNVISFLILHEITAVLPVFGLAYAFHYFRWLPPYFAEGKWMIEGVEKFGKYAKKKGWIQEEEELEVESTAKKGRAWLYEEGKMTKRWNKAESTSRWLVELGTAYAVVKVLFIPRIMLSVWAAPLLARTLIIPIRNLTRASWAFLKARVSSR